MIDTIEEIYKKYPKIFPTITKRYIYEEVGWAKILNILCEVFQSDTDNWKHEQPTMLEVGVGINGLILDSNISDNYQLVQIRFI